MINPETDFESVTEMMNGNRIWIQDPEPLSRSGSLRRYRGRARVKGALLFKTILAVLTVVYGSYT